MLRAVWALCNGESADSILVPGIGLFLTLAIGAVLGAFLGAFVASVRRTASPLQGLWVGALALLALSVGYSLPVYHGAISELIQDAGLSTVKISVADITLEAALAAKGKQGEVSGSGGASGSTAQAVLRPTDPTPGVRALKYDFVTDVRLEAQTTPGSGDKAPKLKRDIISRDLAYLDFTIPKDAEILREIKASLTEFLKPISLLAKCLDEYRGSVQDSQLLLIDVSSSMRPLFLMHNEFKEQVKKIVDPRSYSSLPRKKEYTDSDYNSLQHGVERTIKTAVDTLFHADYLLGNPTQCVNSLTALTEDELNYLKQEDPRAVFREPGPMVTLYQPYVTIALASLLVAHGAPDEAVAVLAEWLSAWEQLAHRAEARMPEWYRIEVLARLQVILKDVAGSSNRAFRDVLEQYREVFSTYMEKASRPLRLADIRMQCAVWQIRKNDSSDVERALAYILWGTEVDSLRTELSFIPETNDFEALWKLRNRAAAVRNMSVECLPRYPNETFTPDYRAGLVAESSVVAGLVAIATAERMSGLGRSSSDRNVISDTRKEGRDWLTTGWADLAPIWDKETKLMRQQPWVDRVFGGTQWDQTASLALRVISRLHQEE